MSAIEDLRKAREALYGGVWTWERHGDGWALYVNRGLPLDPTETGPFVSRQHGLNILSVGSDGFDSRGEQLRAFILAAAEKVPVLAAERDVRDAAWVRLVKAQVGPIVGSEEAREAARQALRDLGVDVDALLGSP